MIILLLSFAVIYVYYAIKKINLNSKVEEHFFLKEISEIEDVLEKFNKLPESVQEKIYKDFEEKCKLGLIKKRKA